MEHFFIFKSFKKWKFYLLPLFLIGIFIFFHNAQSSSSFSEFTLELFRHELSNNTLNLHYTLSHPQSYGISYDTISFGCLDKNSFEKECAYLKNCQETLKNFQKFNSSKDAWTAQILAWWLEGQIALEDFYYYQEPLSPTLGIQAQLPVLLAEFSFREVQDITIYFALLKEIPFYFESILEFETEKSKLGLFMSDEILAEIQSQCFTLAKKQSSHILISSFSERIQDCEFLNKEQKLSYEINNETYLQKYVYPSYESLAKGLEELKGSGKNEQGLYHLPEGLSYYEYLLKYSVGTNRSIASIQQLLEEQMDTNYEIILYALEQGVDIEALFEKQTESRSPAEILSDLQEAIKENFPEISEISWKVKEVPEALGGFLSPAFYMTPAIDTPQENIIYINPAYELDRTELITTLAHEGYPGHLYQNSFEQFSDEEIIRNCIYIGGYSEGWGMYSEFYAYDFLGLSKLEAEVLRAVSSFNYALCANLDLAIHAQGWSEEDCQSYLSAFGIYDEAEVHNLYLTLLEEPSNYLKYYLGYLEICKLKESVPQISAYDFHQWFLEAGPAPFYLLEEQLATSSLQSTHLPQLLLKYCTKPLQVSNALY